MCYIRNITIRHCPVDPEIFSDKCANATRHSDPAPEWNPDPSGVSNCAGNPCRRPSRSISSIPRIDALSSLLPGPCSRVSPMMLGSAPALVDSSGHAGAWVSNRREDSLHDYRSRSAGLDFERHVDPEPGGQAVDIERPPAFYALVQRLLHIH